MRELNGHAARSVTVDADGNVLSVTVNEPRFTRWEVARLLASRRREKQPRGDHGYTIAEATDPANMGRFKLGMPVTDFAAKARAEGLELAKKTYGDDAMQWLLFQVEES